VHHLPGQLCHPAQRAHAELAQAFINYFHRPEVAGAFINDCGFNTPNRAATRHVEAWLLRNPASFPTLQRLRVVSSCAISVPLSLFMISTGPKSRPTLSEPRLRLSAFKRRHGHGAFEADDTSAAYLAKTPTCSAASGSRHRSSRSATALRSVRRPAAARSHRGQSCRRRRPPRWARRAASGAMWPTISRVWHR